MIDYYYILVGLCALVALKNYRVGVGLMLLAGLIGDPVRKLSPGNPVIISVAFSVIFLVIYCKAVLAAKPEKKLWHYFPQFKMPMVLLFILIGVNFLRPIIEKTAYAPLALYSTIQYLGLFIAVQTGFYLVDRDTDVSKICKVFLVLLTPFLVSGVLDFSGINVPIFRSMGRYQEVQYHAGVALKMVGGLFRNPESLGWYGFMGFACAFLVMIRKSEAKFVRIYALVFSLVAVFCTLLSGRRKFTVEIVIFIVLFLLFRFRKDLKKGLKYILYMVMVVLGGRYILGRIQGEELYLESAKSGFESAYAEFMRRGVSAIGWAIRRDGFWGRGMGASSQGGEHFSAKLTEGPGIEAGTGKLFSELGVVGAILIAVILFQSLRVLYKMISDKQSSDELEITEIFLFAIVTSHIIGFGMSHQIYADPLIAVITGFAFGAALSVPKMIEKHGATQVSVEFDQDSFGELKP